ncbi:hypothetical protein AMATHDRAFT_149478 [Amanita thiersii Skay4041]|uniref:T6SS Phospholipase effector Tle1-like catalytic domain-containing protein n=1 Tax=Amanita thiersii Skay4041 TaxID=703135 RepID=A0A2A9NJX5_9AGAR|nr:hypothetical protein AMATHDRAFT_149478 [Amanita thiersii Skay4041]
MLRSSVRTSYLTKITHQTLFEKTSPRLAFSYNGTVASDCINRFSKCRHASTRNPTVTPCPPNRTKPPSNVWPPIDQTRNHRTLVLCFDGTGDEFDSDNTNVVNFVRILKKDDPNTQMAYYQTGIGTHTVSSIAVKITEWIDQGIAWHIDRHVIDGYEFLMQHYEPGDKICIFGYSRGAYIARSLAGMLHAVGLLPRGNRAQTPFAYRMYESRKKGMCELYKRTYSLDVDVEFVGVWDTVCSVGAFFPRTLPFTVSNKSIRTFRHALSLDERRVRFPAYLWGYQSHSDADEIGVPIIPNLSTSHDTSSIPPTDVEEVWFAGCHGDVGGGSVLNGTRPKLAHISLRWMIRECFRRDSGVLFDPEGLKDLGLDPTTLYPEVTKRPPALFPNETHYIKSPTKYKQPPVVPPNLAHMSEEERELCDALAPMHDHLVMTPLWFALECLPLGTYFGKRMPLSMPKRYFNLGRGRAIPEGRRVKLHRSVLTRMQAHYEDGSRYIPKAKMDNSLVDWVE